jgi:hypothetical protein
LALADYAGSYDNPCYGKLTIAAEQGGQLVMTLGPKATKFLLTHYHGDTFFFTTQGEMQTGLSGAVFKLDGKKIVSLTLNAYDVEGPGVFERLP